MPESQQTAERATEGENGASVASEAIFTETIKEEQDSMNEVIEAFWSGATVSAAAILLGEAAALLVAAAWMKIRRNDHA